MRKKYRKQPYKCTPYFKRKMNRLTAEIYKSAEKRLSDIFGEDK